jgi:hypothetical protein
MVGDESEWDDCNVGEVASCRAEDLSGRTTRSGGDTRPDAETMGNESGNGMNSEGHAYGSET